MLYNFFEGDVIMEKPTYFSRKSFISGITKKSSYIKHGVCGKSILGRDIDFVTLGNTNKMVLWTCAFHGMEWLTTLVIFKFLNKICALLEEKNHFCGINLKNNLENRGLMIIPCVNPDGVEISISGSKTAGKYKNLIDETKREHPQIWQANARGVDLNHNYDAGWGELHELGRANGRISPNWTRYGGEFPESEPETQAIIKICSKYNFDHAIAFHSQGEEIYWKYGENIPQNSEKIAKIFALASGYTLSQPEGLAIGGGFKDWFIEKIHKPGFTIELGKGKNPLPLECLNMVYDKIEKLLFMSIVI